MRAISIIIKKQKNNCEIFNIGLDEVKNVKNSIRLIKKYSGIKKKVVYGNNRQGWIGDNPFILLDTKKIRSSNWRPKFTIRKSVEITTKYLLENLWLLKKN